MAPRPTTPPSHSARRSIVTVEVANAGATCKYVRCPPGRCLSRTHAARAISGLWSKRRTERWGRVFSSSPPWSSGSHGSSEPSRRGFETQRMPAPRVKSNATSNPPVRRLHVNPRNWKPHRRRQSSLKSPKAVSLGTSRTRKPHHRRDRC